MKDNANGGRKEFLKTCALGACGCGIPGLLAQAEAGTDRPADPSPARADETARLKLHLDGARERFALLYGIFEEELDEAGRDRILRQLGGACSRKLTPLLQKYKGDLKGFLAFAETTWLERAILDEKAGTLRVVGKPAPCACPLVKPSRTPASFCRCTLGWQEAVFSTLMGKPVTAEIEETVLGGGTRCSFLIRFQ